MSKEFTKKLWVELYRPKNIEECILPNRLKEQLHVLVKDGEIPSMLFAGSAGSGKTSVARAICNELDCDNILINCSDENGVDAVRVKIKQFAATTSLVSDAKHKVIILDESDYLSTNAQAILRGMMEEFAANCRFIFTCNFKNRIIDPLRSRCSVVDFSFTKDEKVQMMTDFMKRVMMILKENNVPFEAEVVAKYIQAKFPDFRSILNELQRYSASGSIDVGILRSTGEDVVNEILKFLKAQDFKAMRQWVDANDSIDIPSLFDKLYDSLYDAVENMSKPDMILILDEYQSKAATAINQRINMAACMTQLMGNLKFK